MKKGMKLRDLGDFCRSRVSHRPFCVATKQRYRIIITYEELEILLEEVNAELDLDELVLDVVLKHC
jgi:hypothetical protein